MSKLPLDFGEVDFDADFSRARDQVRRTEIRIGSSESWQLGIADQQQELVDLDTQLQRKAVTDVAVAISRGRRVIPSAIRLHKTLLLRNEHLATLLRSFEQRPADAMTPLERSFIETEVVLPDIVGVEPWLMHDMFGHIEAGRYHEAWQLLNVLRLTNDQKRRASLRMLLKLSENPGKSFPTALSHRVGAGLNRMTDMLLGSHLGTRFSTRVLASEASSWELILDKVSKHVGPSEPDLDEDREERLLELISNLDTQTLQGASSLPPQAAEAPKDLLPPPRPLPPGTPNRFERTPHMRLSEDEPLAPEAEFEVDIWADREAEQHGENSSNIVFELPPGIEEARLRVLLTVSRHFDVTRLPRWPLILKRREANSNHVVFVVRVKTAAELAALATKMFDPAQGTLTAHFYLNDRPSGKVTRRVMLRSMRNARPAPESPPGKVGLTGLLSGPADVSPRLHRIVAEGQALRADMMIHIKQRDRADWQRYDVTVTTAEERVTAEWTLNHATRDVVADYMSDFTNSRNQLTARRDALVGAGKRLFRLAPEHFRKAFWRLVDAGQPPTTISIVSEEPYIPWELMIPNEKGRDSRDPLGIEFSVGRWTTDESISAPQVVALHHSLIVAPEYEGKDRLEHAEKEAAFVSSTFTGEKITPAIYSVINERLETEAVGLLHFVCHGDIGQHGVGQVLKLERDQVLSVIQVEGSKGFERALGSGHSFVFLNACKAGRLLPELVGLGGFAPTFISLGAGAVVAPLWSVKDLIAHEVATIFYTQILEHPDKAFSQVLQDIRRRAYEADDPEDSWAAYCFYGDPLARKAS